MKEGIVSVDHRSRKWLTACGFSRVLLLCTVGAVWSPPLEGLPNHAAGLVFTVILSSLDLVAVLSCAWIPTLKRSDSSLFPGLRRTTILGFVVAAISWAVWLLALPGVQNHSIYELLWTDALIKMLAIPFIFLCQPHRAHLEPGYSWWFIVSDILLLSLVACLRLASLALSIATALAVVTAQLHLIVANVLLIHVAGGTDVDDAVSQDQDNRWYDRHSD